MMSRVVCCNVHYDLQGHKEFHGSSYPPLRAKWVDGAKQTSLEQGSISKTHHRRTQTNLMDSFNINKEINAQHLNH